MGHPCPPSHMSFIYKQSCTMGRWMISVIQQHADSHVSNYHRILMGHTSDDPLAIQSSCPKCLLTIANGVVVIHKCCSHGPPKYNNLPFTSAKGQVVPKVTEDSFFEPLRRPYLKVI